jgi:hypothetical protein
MTETMKRTGFVMMFAMLAATAVARANNGSMSVSPAVVTLSGQVGQSTTQTLSFTNGTPWPLSFEMKAQDAVVRDGAHLFVEAGTIAGSIAATAAFSPRTFTVAPQQTIRIGVTITIPPKPAVRAIAVMCQGTTKLGSGPMRMIASIGTLFTFVLSGDVMTAEVSPLIIQPPTSSASLVALQQIANSGTGPMVGVGMLAILDARGTLIGQQEIPEWRMLPGEKIDMRVGYDGELLPGRYRALITYDLADKTLTSSAEFSVR